MEPTVRNSTRYSPKTEQERNESVRLLDELEKELARGGSGEFGWPRAARPRRRGSKSRPRLASYWPLAEMRGESRRMALFGSGGNACRDPSTRGRGVVQMLRSP
jgi:hypothetical protein